MSLEVTVRYMLLKDNRANFGYGTGSLGLVLRKGPSGRAVGGHAGGVEGMMALLAEIPVMI